MKKRDKLYKQLKRLKQYKSVSKEEIYNVVDDKIQHDEILEGLTFAVKDDEKKNASNMIKKYLSDSTIENEADKDTLKQLIDLELLLERIKLFIKKEYEERSGSIPLKMMEQLREITKQILDLKNNIGLSGGDKEKTDAIENWELLQKKAIAYYEKNAGCILQKCPSCQAIYQLMFDRTKYKEAKCNWYRGTILYNPYLYEIFHSKRITKKEMANIFNVSEFQIDYLYNNIFLKDLENDK